MGKGSRELEGSGKELAILTVPGSSSAAGSYNTEVVIGNDKNDGKLHEVVLIDAPMEVKTRKKEVGMQGVYHDGVGALSFGNRGDMGNEGDSTRKKSEGREV